ncbi:IclR family transcriptional regulator [Streptomyces formicae]|uniref:IclR family transcriptional regulator n=1 Tax=Streptomyces formicae TaxID=1616117 RepID=A0ABY3WR89_9ACTN|nr:IclR family transcriptional regulator [Streptomyces formicae]UNM13011.1 IclR family transcriptional regulator [Streptomyces formicae]
MSGRQSTAHRLMAMLVYHGFVEQDPSSRLYRAGSALVGIGLAAVQRMDVRAVARPLLQSLAAETGATVHLGVSEGTQVRFVDGVESELALRVSNRTGRVLPAHTTSLGKAMLARLPREQVRALYPTEALTHVTAATTTRRSELIAKLERVRTCGYALNAGESEDGVGSVGVGSVGVAVVRPSGALAGGLSIGAPLSRISDEKRERYLRPLTEAGGKLAALLAWAVLVERPGVTQG